MDKILMEKEQELYEVYGWEWDYGAFNKSTAYAWTVEKNLTIDDSDDDNIEYTVTIQRYKSVKYSELEKEIEHNNVDPIDYILENGFDDYAVDYSKDFDNYNDALEEYNSIV
jgi:hypothetical protein